MKAIFAALAIASSIPAFADAPGNGYPQNQQPPPLEELEPEQPTTCVRAYGCGNVYSQVPQKICQIVVVGQSRLGTVYAVTRFGQQLTLGGRLYNQIQADAAHYQRVIEVDGRPICEVVF